MLVVVSFGEIFCRVDMALCDVLPCDVAELPEVVDDVFLDLGVGVCC